jgi:hypothetical protein
VLHAGNGAIAGVLFAALDRRLPGTTKRNAVAFALVESVATYPLTALSDRYHPARGAADLPPMAHSARGFGQALWRHLLFGLVLGALLERHDRPDADTTS